MSILTKEERAEMRRLLKRLSGSGSDFWQERMTDALDTIDKLEAERDALETERDEFIKERDSALSTLEQCGVVNERGLAHSTAVLGNAYEGARCRASELRKERDEIQLSADRWDNVAAALHDSRERAKAHAVEQLPTRVIGGHRQALERVIELLGGEK